MLERGSVEWWQDLLDRYEAVRGRMTQVEFCERAGISHNAFVHRRFGKWPHRRSPKAVEGGSEGEMLRVKVAEPVRATPAVMEAEVRSGVTLRFVVGTDSEYLSDLLLRLAGHLGGTGAQRC